ncbi:ABC transporter permease [Actinomyces oricola]
MTTQLTLTAPTRPLARALSILVRSREITAPNRVERRRRLRAAVGLAAPTAVLATVLIAALAPMLLTSADPLAVDAGGRFLAPSAEHWFGTDYLGRDIFSRVVHGTGLTLRATALALAISLLASSALGLLAGFLGGWIDTVISRAVDVVLSIPALLLSLVLVTALGTGTLKVAVAVGLASVAALTRLTRGEVLKASTSRYVEAARLSGVRWYTILWRHVLPHATGPVIALLALQIGEAILTIAGLSFLGFGAQLPTPEWGSIVSEGRNYLANAPWMTTLPGAVIIATVVSANRLSHAISEHGKEALR